MIVVEFISVIKRSSVLLKMKAFIKFSSESIYDNIPGKLQLNNSDATIFDVSCFLFT